MTRSVKDTDMYYYPFQISGVKKRDLKRMTNLSRCFVVLCFVKIGDN